MAPPRIAVLLAVACPLLSAVTTAASSVAASAHHRPAAPAGSGGSRLGLALLETGHVREQVDGRSRRRRRRRSRRRRSRAEDIRSGDSVFFRVARTGKRLTAEADGDLHADLNHTGDRQQFVIEEETGSSGAIVDGDKVFLTVGTGNVITVEEETVHAKWDHRGSWQMLTVSRKAGPGHLATGDSIFLRGHLGKYIDADAPGSDGRVQARFKDEGAWQELVVEAVEPRTTTATTTTTTTTTTPAPACVEKQSLGMCQQCLRTDQCQLGTYCDPYMKKCMTSSGAGCLAPAAECVPLCLDHMDPRECACANKNFPDNWQNLTCGDSLMDIGDVVGKGSEVPKEVSAEAWEHFRMLNELRAEGFTCPEGTVFAPNPDALKFDCRLWQAARLHAEDMAENSYLGHESKDGRSPWQRAADRGATATDENIVAGRGNASAALRKLQGSDRNCKTMLNPDLKVAAVGYAAGGHHRHYWTQMFSGSDASDLDTSCYPPEAGDTSLLGVATAAVQPQHGGSASGGHESGEDSDVWDEGKDSALLEPAVRTW